MPVPLGHIPKKTVCWVALSLCLSAGSCALDAESAVRERLGAWVQLAQTVYFTSTRDCSAGAFEVVSNQIKAPVRVVQSVDEGLHWMHQDDAGVLAFDIRDLSPTELSERLMRADLPEGLGVLSAGVAARDCMDPAQQADYLAALTGENSLLMLDMSDNGLAVLDRRARRIYFARGNVQ